MNSQEYADQQNNLRDLMKRYREGSSPKPATTSAQGGGQTYIGGPQRSSGSSDTTAHSDGIKLIAQLMRMGDPSAAKAIIPFLINQEPGSRLNSFQKTDTVRAALADGSALLRYDPKFQGMAGKRYGGGISMPKADPATQARMDNFYDSMERRKRREEDAYQDSREMSREKRKLALINQLLKNSRLNQGKSITEDTEEIFNSAGAAQKVPIRTTRRESGLNEGLLQILLRAL